MVNRRNFWAIVILSFPVFAVILPTVCYAGIGQPLPVRNESSQVAVVERPRVALPEELRIGGDIRYICMDIVTGLLVFLILYLLGYFNNPKSGKWERVHEKPPDDNSG